MAVDEKIYRFGEFQLDPATRKLERGGEVVQVETRVFELLLYLVSQRGRTVSRSELTEALWGEVKVSDGSLRRTVSLLRKALDARGPSGTTLETVHGRGYRFAANVEEAVRELEISDRAESEAPTSSQRPAEVSDSVAPSGGRLGTTRESGYRELGVASAM